MEGRVRRGKGLRGLAEVRQVGSAYQVKLDGEIFEFPRNAAPKGVQTGKFHVSLSGRGDKWYSMTPAADDTYTVHCIGFTAKEGEEPKPFQDPGGWKEHNGKRWFADPSQSCTAILEIKSGKYKNLTFNYFLPYIFVEENGVIDFEGSESQVEKVTRFMAATGTAKWDPEPAENLLPSWQEAILAADRTFKIVGEDGRATKILAGDADDEDEKPARRSRKQDDDEDIPTPRSARGRQPVEDDEEPVRSQARSRRTVNIPKPAKRGRK